MSGRIPDSFIDEVVARANIVDVVDSRVRLKKAGKNYTACCPFHNEKSPSFSVSSDKQFYYCFGCGASGNALKFIMEFDGIPFPDAVEKLAGTLGMQVPHEESSAYQQKQQQEKTSLYDLMNQANLFFQQQLKFHPDKSAAVNYLKKRGLTGQTAKYFNVGYAPDGWDNLKRQLDPNGDKEKFLIECGMLIEKDDGRSYDRFRNRIMYPIRDMRGRTIGFGARTLGDEKPKYLNSPETPIFNKGQELYGLYECRQIRQTLKRLLVVEGYMDVVALHQYGIHYAVATLGTATSETHLQKIFKIVPEVVFCFDGDAAGRRAAKRALEIVLPILEDGWQVRFLFLPDGEDPDTLVRQEGKEAFEERIHNAMAISEFLIKSLYPEVENPDSIDGRARLAKLAAPMVALIPGLALRGLMNQALAEHTGLPLATIEALGKYETRPAQVNRESHKESDRAPQPAAERPIPSAQDNNEDLSSAIPIPLLDKALGLLLHTPAGAQTISDEHLAICQSLNHPQASLLCKMVTKLRESPQNGLTEVLTLFSLEPEFQQLRQLAQQHHPLWGNQTRIQEVTDCFNQIKRMANKQELTRIKHKLGRVNGQLQQLTQEEQKRYLQLLQDKGIEKA